MIGSHYGPLHGASTTAPQPSTSTIRGIEEILDAVCEDIEGEMATALSKALENSAAHSVLVDLGMAYIEYALSHRDDFRLLYLRPLSPRARQVVEIFQHQLSKAAGLHADFPSFDFEEDEMAHAMWATAHGLVMLSLTRDAILTISMFTVRFSIEWSLVSEDSSDPTVLLPMDLSASGSGGWQGAGSFWPPLRRCKDCCTYWRRRSS